MLLSSLILLTVFLAPAHGAGVKVMFDPSTPEIGPFPTDYLTAPATNTKTARRVRMPPPSDCTAQPNACQEAFLLADFDGFNLLPRVRVRFSGPINPDTIKAGIFFIARENLTQDEPGLHQTGDIVPLNRIVYDPATNTAYGKPDAAMDQHRRYLLVVTDAVKDQAGDPVEPDPAFTSCAISDSYCKSLTDGLQGATGTIAGASIFTTMSATAWIEKARDQLVNIPPSPLPLSGRSVFATEDLATVNWHQQVSSSPTAFQDVSLPVYLLQVSVKAVTFGSYTSPSYLGNDRTIPAASSAGDLAPAAATEQIGYTAYLPRKPRPDKGYPVIVYGHLLGDSRIGGPAVMSLFAADQGIATIAISAPGHGYGPASVLQVVDGSGGKFDIPVPGRGVDTNGDGRIDSSEGCAAVASSPLGIRDCVRQTAVDQLQLIRAIRAGLDTDGDGIADFDPDRIYYVGQSLGTLAGAMILSAEPSIISAALNSGGGSVVDIARWSPNFRPQVIQTLGLRKPSLLNVPGSFDESYVLRDQPVKVVTTPGAIDIQNTLETLEWLQSEGDAVSYVPHLKRSLLQGGTEKNILWLFATGDATVANPMESALVRYAGMQSSTWIYRHDIAHQRDPSLDLDPHPYMTNIVGDGIFIVRGVLTQVVQFFGTGVITDPNGNLAILFGANIFEQPAELPEDLNFLEP